MNAETYTKLYENYKPGQLLRPHGKAMALSFSLPCREGRRFRLFAAGETGMFYQWKDEPDGPIHYRTVDDALDTTHADTRRYCLNLSAKIPANYVRRVYKKVMWPPVLSYLAMNPVPETWVVGIRACTENLQLAENGYVQLRLEVRYKQEGVSPRSVADMADEVHLLPIPADTNGWQDITQSVTISPDRTAHVGMWVEAFGYTGKIWLEHPMLIAETGENLLPDFELSAPDKAKFSWTAQNLSRKEWPEFRLSLNGEVFFEGEIFERCHRASEWELALPSKLLRDENRLEIQLISDYRDPLPYFVQELGILSRDDSPVTILGCSPAGSVQEGACVLLRTRKENPRVQFESDLLRGEGDYFFAEAGLHGIRLACPKPGENLVFTLRCGDFAITDTIPQIAERMPDNVCTGTGDLIYIPQDADQMEEFLSWYVANGVGNLLTIRPTYRWSGTRTLQREVWKPFVRVLNELGIRYALMLDGRELPGINANPDDGLLAGPGYLGSQTHERDGQAWYWTVRTTGSLFGEQYWDMAQRMYREDPLHTNNYHASENVYPVGNEVYNFRNPQIPRDYKAAMEHSVEALARNRHGVLRHTGPSVMFKYLFQAGYKWLGAETMYGSMEPLMAFLRGACKAAGTNDMGVHHAVQWSSSPQDSREHFLRYRLALYVSYMQGATQINTEEGLWHLEEYYSHFTRFSDGCKGHLKQQQAFAKYAASHSRTGTFRAPMALLHGRYDGWHAFGNDHTWGWSDGKNNDPEQSWDLLKVFYPLSRPGEALYLHGCDTDHPVGYHTGTPLGNIDVLPAERDLWQSYRALAFLGYHCWESSDCEKLRQFVGNGGKLLLTRAHLADTTEYALVAAGQLHETETGFSVGTPVYAEHHINGIPVTVCTNPAPPEEVSQYTDEGAPLVCSYAGGRVTLVNALAYPAHPAIRPLYEAKLRAMMEAEIAKEPTWPETGDDMGSAVYDQSDGSRHVYFLAVDWYRPEAVLRRAYLREDGYRYPVELPFGIMTKCVVKEGYAAWPHGEDGEVLRIVNGTAWVQGTGTVAFTLARGGESRSVTVDFSGNAVQEIQF